MPFRDKNQPNNAATNLLGVIILIAGFIKKILKRLDYALIKSNHSSSLTAVAGMKQILWAVIDVMSHHCLQSSYWAKDKFFYSKILKDSGINFSLVKWVVYHF